MAETSVLPGFGIVMEDSEEESVLPGFGIVAETQAAAVTVEGHGRLLSDERNRLVVN